MYKKKSIGKEKQNDDPYV